MISDFNSIFQLGFAINIILVFFDLIPKMEKDLKQIMKGDVIFDKDYDFKNEKESEKDQTFIYNYGWKSILFSYINIKETIQIMSGIASFVFLFLLFVSGFYPLLNINRVLMLSLLIILFGIPIFYLWEFYYILPHMRRNLIKEGRKKLYDIQGHETINKRLQNKE